jgi:hypothetical protein
MMLMNPEDDFIVKQRALEVESGEWRVGKSKMFLRPRLIAFSLRVFRMSDYYSVHLYNIVTPPL